MTIFSKIIRVTFWKVHLFLAAAIATKNFLILPIKIVRIEGFFGKRSIV
jgi:hypothetical protein